MNDQIQQIIQQNTGASIVYEKDNDGTRYTATTGNHSSSLYVPDSWLGLMKPHQLAAQVSKELTAALAASQSKERGKKSLLNRAR